MDIIIIIIALIWLIFASIQDLKTREVPDWVSYSLMIIAFMAAILKSILLKNTFIIISLFGFFLFLILGSLMYYTKQFGGGDVKILVGLGALIPIYPKELLNYFNPNLDLPFFLILILNIILIGALYGLFYAIYLLIKNKNKIKLRKYKINKIYLLISLILIILQFLFNDPLLRLIIIFLALMLILIPYLHLFIKILEKNVMIKKIPIGRLTEGDWIINNIYHKNKLIYNKNSPGVSKTQILLLKKFGIKNVIIKEGLPFIPTFLLALIVSLIFGNLFMLG